MHHVTKDVFLSPSWEVGSVSHSRAWEAAFPCRHTPSQALCWTVRIKVKGRDYFFGQNVRKLNLFVYWLLELFRKMSPDRMCENQGKARIKNPWIKNLQTKRWGECVRTKVPVARQVCHAWISRADDRKPVRGWRTMTKPTQGKLNSQLQISGTFLGVTKLGSYLPVRKQLSCCSQEKDKAVYCLLFSNQVGIPTRYSMPQEDKGIKIEEEK